MGDPLVAATEAYRAALSAVTEAAEALRTARNAVPEAREALAAQIVAAYRSGRRVGDIARVTGYGREQVRRVLRAHGVGAE